MNQRVRPEVAGPMTSSAKSGASLAAQSWISLPFNPGCPHIAKTVLRGSPMDFAVARPILRYALPQFKNVRTLCTLAEKSAIQRGVPQLRRLGIKQNAKENSRRIRAMRLGCRNFLIARRATN
jgi:hypothetical protein